MWAMNPKDKRELDAYRALGTVEELKERLENPYPKANTGYAPLPFEDGVYSGLLEDDDFDPDWEDK